MANRELRRWAPIKGGADLTLQPQAFIFHAFSSDPSRPWSDISLSCCTSDSWVAMNSSFPEYRLHPNQA
jgi:hypothetical protein